MSNDHDLLAIEDGCARCEWCGSDAQYIAYHDTEWGRPTIDDRYLFEKICLEGFQAGLSWLTILRKRENFRNAFAQFDMERIANFGKRDVTRLLKNAGIVRHRGKIESTINNAGRAIELIEAEGSLHDYVWRFAPAEPRRYKHLSEVPAQTAESRALSKDFRRRGFSFVGPTTAYAFMQSVGIVNDHLTDCHVFSACEDARCRKVGAGGASR